LPPVSSTTTSDLFDFSETMKPSSAHVGTYFQAQDIVPHSNRTVARCTYETILSVT